MIVLIGEHFIEGINVKMLEYFNKCILHAYPNKNKTNRAIEFKFSFTFYSSLDSIQSQFQNYKKSLFIKQFVELIPQFLNSTFSLVCCKLYSGKHIPHDLPEMHRIRPGPIRGAPFLDTG